MPRNAEFTVPFELDGFRLDIALNRLMPECSRSFVQKMIKSGAVQCGDEVVTAPKSAVKNGMRITAAIPDDEPPELKAADFNFEILYEDSAMLVINKPSGVVVHPAAGNREGTVVNALLGRYPEMQERTDCDETRPGIVHRLDKDTSGCLIIARTAAAQYRLGAAFANRETEKYYLAIVRGIPKTPDGKIESLIGRHPVNRQKMAVVERNGKNALTSWTLLSDGKLPDGTAVSMLKVRIYTGRTHQIRVHLSHIGFPVLGDAVYGGAAGRTAGVERQMLHAWRLTLPHPSSGKKTTFTAPPPPDFAAAAQAAGLNLPES